MRLWPKDELIKLPRLNLAVVGHVEWMTFLSVDKLPKAGLISHSKMCFEEPAGGGAVTAAQMRKLIGKPVDFYTVLGKDPIGEKCYERLTELGLKLFVSWKDKPTRKGISFVDSDGERAITVIGERLQPDSSDMLPWENLKKYHGIFLTACDSKIINMAREANVLVATPRVGKEVLIKSKVKLDALIGSGLDPDEQIDLINPLPSLKISTHGKHGGEIYPGGHFEAVELKTEAIDTYGCGDSFAAGVTAALAAGWTTEQAISLGAHCGAECTKHYGPYSKLEG